MREFVKCRCCLEDGELREMWSEYAYKGGSEVYGAMLLECFSLQLRSLADCTEYICETCVERLRGAYQFRQSVIMAQEVWDRMIEENEKEDLKKGSDEKYVVEDSEADKSDSKNHDAKKSDSHNYSYEIEVMMAEGQDSQLSEDNASSEDPLTRKPESADDDSQDDGDHQDGDEHYIDDGEDDSTMDPEYLEDLSEDEPPKKRGRKIVLPKKPKRTPRQRSYKQYTKEDLLKAIKAIRDNKMTRTQASRIYNIPGKTLSTKFKAMSVDPEIDTLEADEIKPDSEDEETQNRRLHFYEEILTILHFTNATPYKWRAGKLYCAYCFTEGLQYENKDVDELRKHTKTKHTDIQVSHVRDFMKPYYLNETCKLDINKLWCTACPKKLDDWNDMFKHLVEEHDAVFDHAYSKVIPFKLGDDIVCALCGEKFPHYQNLDVHMNVHYANYICGECGGTYLSESRLKKHETIHSTSKFPCELCNRVFSLDKYRRKHYENIHVKRDRFNCRYCTEKFNQDYKRHLHVTEKHPEKLVTYKCEYCGSSFSWKAYYYKHIRLQHQPPEKKYKCKICSKRFNQRHELRNHLQWHLGNGYTCDVCDTKFCSKSYLQKHMEAHEEEGQDESVKLALKLVRAQAS